MPTTSWRWKRSEWIFLGSCSSGKQTTTFQCTELQHIYLMNGCIFVCADVLLYFQFNFRSCFYLIDLVDQWSPAWKNTIFSGLVFLLKHMCGPKMLTHLSIYLSLDWKCRGRQKNLQSPNCLRCFWIKRGGGGRLVAIQQCLPRSPFAVLLAIWKFDLSCVGFWRWCKRVAWLQTSN